MSELSPRISAELAAGVYGVRTEFALQAFLSRNEFSNKNDKKQLLTAEIGGRIIRNAKDGFGICAMGGNNYKNELFLIFRGTTDSNNNADWLSNARIGITPSKTGLPVHIGFNNIFTSMLPHIKEFLDANKNITAIHCIGHSLGGAIATLTADWVKSNQGKMVKLYTFGAPKPGLILFSANFTRKLGKQNIFRAYHATDPVPMIPLFPFIQPPLPGFGHYIPSNESILSADAHDMRKYINSVNKSSWSELERRSPPYAIESVVEQWLKSNVPVSASSPKIWEWINASLIYVLKKTAGAAIVALQASFMGALTIADTIAWILKKGIDLSKAASQWVIHLMRKIMQVLGMKVIDSSKALTQALMRTILTRLMDRTTNEAKRAIMRIN